MKLLALDTATEACSAALSIDGEVNEIYEVIGRGHADRLLPMVDELLRKAGIAMTALDAIAFGCGPGGFTGLRIAAGTAQGLAAGIGRPVLPVSDLAALAAALAALASFGLGLAIVSNADGTVEADLLKYEICQVGPGAGVTVDAILDSTAVGVAKPDPAIFLQALDALGVPPERAIHVGDTPAADIAGARAAGIRPVLVDPYDLHPDAECVRVRSLAELVELLAT
jgi:FMN phosphatase YigB (HAD superfamily)